MLFRSDQVVWYSHLFQNFPQLIVIHTVKDFGLVNKAEIDGFVDFEVLISKVMLKILQARLHQYVNYKLPDVQAGLKKAEEPEIKLPTSAGSLKKQESSRRTSISALLTRPKPLTVWITRNCGKF